MARRQLGPRASRVDDGATLQDAAAATAQTALATLYGRFAKRDTASAAIVSAGSSTPYGQGASVDARRMMNRLVAALQADFPLSTSAAQPVAKYLADVAGTTLPAGIQYVNAAVSGSSSSGYLTATTAAQVGALNPAAVIHMPVANDYAANTNPGTSKSNILAKIDAINAAVTGPIMPVHILVQGHRRTNNASPTFAWSAYGTILKEIADAAPSSRIFVDLYSVYASVLQDTTDPLTLNDPDKTHLSDAGHALGADALRAALRETVRINAFTAVADPTPPADTTAPSISSFSATGGDSQVSLSWSVSDNVGVTRVVVKRTAPSAAAATIVDTTMSSTTSYTDTGRTNDTQCDYLLEVYDAAGNKTTATAFATPTSSALPTMSNTAAPSIAPTNVTAGNVLTVTDGTWNPAPDSIARQWRRDGVDMSGQTGTSYTTVASDAGKAITCAEVPSKSGYQTGAAVVSNAVTPAAASTGGDYKTNLLARFNADSVASLGDGAQVPTITSSEGSLGSITLVQLEGSNASTRPIVKTAQQNGHAVLRFASASNQKLQSPASSIPNIQGTGTTWVYAFKRTGAAARYFGGNSSSNYHTLFQNSSALTFGNSTVSGGNLLAHSSPPVQDKWVIVVVVMVGASSKMFVSYQTGDGTNATITGTLDTVTAQGITMGGSGSGSGFATMDVYEERVYSEAVSDANVATIISALKSQLGLTA